MHAHWIRFLIFIYCHEISVINDLMRTIVSGWEINWVWIIWKCYWVLAFYTTDGYQQNKTGIRRLWKEGCWKSLFFVIVSLPIRIAFLYFECAYRRAETRILVRRGGGGNATFFPMAPLALFSAVFDIPEFVLVIAQLPILPAQKYNGPYLTIYASGRF